MVYVFLADGFEEMEAVTPIDILRRAGCDVATVGVTGEMVTGCHDITVKSDVTEISLRDAEMIILPGGSGGADNLFESKMVTEAVFYCAQNGRRIAAICAAPYILGKLGVLDGKRAVCYPDPKFEKCLENAIISSDPVVTDGNITTGKGAGYSLDFGVELVRILKGEEAAEKVWAGMMCK